MLEKKPALKLKTMKPKLQPIRRSGEVYSIRDPVKDCKCDWRESKLISDNPPCHNFAFRFENI